MVGPVAKIDPAELPMNRTSKFRGRKAYAELPDEVAGWDGGADAVRHRRGDRFVGPTKTPEYLAGGKPVVSTPVTDVVRSYGTLEGVVDRRGTTEHSSPDCEAAAGVARNPAGVAAGRRSDAGPDVLGAHLPADVGGLDRRPCPDAAAPKETGARSPGHQPAHGQEPP